jgi:hypothetical protein
VTTPTGGSKSAHGGFHAEPGQAPAVAAAQGVAGTRDTAGAGVPEVAGSTDTAVPEVAGRTDTAVPDLPRTGDSAVDEALEALTGVVDRPLPAQVDAYGAAHGRLQDRLADLDG